jgi:hypothetical protein
MINKLSLIYRIPKALYLEFWAIIQPIVEIAGIKIRISRNFSGRMRRILRSGSYEQEEITVLSTQLSNDDVVMEVGTGIRLLSSYCATQVDSERVW